MIDILSFWLQPEDRGLEWGSGRSTIWFAKRVTHLISVEHNEVWYRKVSDQLREDCIRNVGYYLCQRESEYVRAAEEASEKTLDFILVDGIARDQCAVKAVSLLKPGGILIIDNSNWYLPGLSYAPNSRRPHQGTASATWEMFLGGVKSWRSIWTTNGVWDTTLWIKPHAD
jgi:predicted O-methyltransferase YrrM